MNRESMLRELRVKFADLINYQADDPTAPIDPLTYRTPEGDSCLHIAALRDDSRAINMLLDLGLDINIKGDMDNTALHYAKDHNARSAYETLISRGAAIDVMNEFGELSGR